MQSSWAERFIERQPQMRLSRRRTMTSILATAAITVFAACGEPKLVELPTKYQGKDRSAEAAATIAVPEEPVSVGPRGPVSVNLGVATGNPLAAQLESQIRGAVADTIDAAENKQYGEMVALQNGSIQANKEWFPCCDLMANRSKHKFILF